jgi:glycosyltransferase EpsD
MASILTRLAARKARKRGTKVIYTAHGFHFFKGAPLLNWLIYYSMERLVARYTDVLITINKEDYARAKKFKAGKVEYVVHIGIDLSEVKYLTVNREQKRAELNIPENAIMLMSVGELSRRKNHEVIIRALSIIQNDNIHYVVCGRGALEAYLKELAVKLNINNRVHILGYRDDAMEIMKSSDIFVFPSLWEGLGMAAIEAMVSGLPIITSNVHGIVDYSIDGKTGYTVKPTDVKGFAAAIKKLAEDSQLRDAFGKHNEAVIEIYTIANSMKFMSKIYMEQK